MSNAQKPEPVGSFYISNSKAGKSYGPVAIYDDDEVYVGRDMKKCRIVMDDDLLVSNHHLYIYTVIFDRDNPRDVPPLVYARDLSMNGTRWNGYAMTPGGAYLLSDGDILRLSDSSCLRYKSQVPSVQCNTLLQRIEMKKFKDYVVSQSSLGSGGYGRVLMAYRKDTGQQLACKIVDLRAVRERLLDEVQHEHPTLSARDIAKIDSYISEKLAGRLELYMREATILENLQHPNIIRLEKVIKSSNTIYLFQDLVAGGDLFSHLQRKGGKLPNIEAAVIVRQITMALDYLHDRGIVHRDLKPDNILMTSLDDGCRVVLTDFGCARVVQPTLERMTTLVGTVDFNAPEVTRRNQEGYTKSVDLWSLGCVTAVLLTGELPFEELRSKPRVTFEQRLKARAKLRNNMYLNSVSPRAQDFVFRLLMNNPSDRMDVKEALNHSWFSNPAHKEEFEALYERSIRDWEPRAANKPIIVTLESLAYSRDSQPSQPLSRHEHGLQAQSIHSLPHIKIDYSAADVYDQESADDESDADKEMGRRALSHTLSDPYLPPHGNISGARVPFSRSLQDNSDNTGPGLNRMHSTGSARRSLLRDIDAVGSSAISDKTRRDSYGNHQARGVATPPRSSQDFLRADLPPDECPGLYVSESAMRSWIEGGTASKRPHSSLEEMEDEVYEDVNNAVTGKRQHLMYGIYPGQME